MPYRPGRRSVLFLLLATLVSTLKVAGQSGADVDSDRDGLSDSVEQQLLEQFRPTLMVSASDCAAKPARFEDGVSFPQVAAKDGTLYGQVSLHGKLLVEIHYFTLWEKDCGRVPHPLDAEHSAVMVSLENPEPRALYWYAGAHEKTACEISSGARAKALDAEFRGARLWSSSGKHALFFREAMCGHGCGADFCGDDVELAQSGPVVNLGEAEALDPKYPWVDSAAWRLRAKMNSDFSTDVIERLDATSGNQVTTLRGSSTIRGTIQGSDLVLGAADTGAQHTQAALDTANSHTSRSLSRAVDATGRAIGRAWRAVFPK
jgi:hypothetical protein